MKISNSLKIIELQIKIISKDHFLYYQWQSFKVLYYFVLTKLCTEQALLYVAGECVNCIVFLGNKLAISIKITYILYPTYLKNCLPYPIYFREMYPKIFTHMCNELSLRLITVALILKAKS